MTMRIFRGAPARQPWWMPLPQLDRGYGQSKGPFAPRPQAAAWKRKTRRCPPQARMSNARR